MKFSKSFSYALRSVLYIAVSRESRQKVQLDEISVQLKIPRHFLAKVMKNLVKHKILGSLKGPYGGFYITDKTMEIPLFLLVKVTGEVEQFSNCVLHFKKCNAQRPCPMHHEIEALKKEWQHLLSSTTIGDLLKKDQPDFIKSIVAA